MGVSPVLTMIYQKDTHGSPACPHNDILERYTQSTPILSNDILERYTGVLSVLTIIYKRPMGHIAHLRKQFNSINT